MDARIDHAVAANDQHEAVVILADEFGRQGIDGLRVFIRSDRFACTDGSDERHRDHLLTAPGVSHDFDRARGVRILADGTFEFQTLQIIVYGGRRAQTDRFSNLTDSRRKAAVPDLLTDKFQDRFLACGQFIRIVSFSHGEVLPLMISRETLIQSLSDFTLEFLYMARNSLTRIASYLRKAMTKLCIKILVGSDSVIESAFPSLSTCLYYTLFLRKWKHLFIRILVWNRR